jgi:uncharacterized membrane protein YphA (DoxX/SURF4 family)
MSERTVVGLCPWLPWPLCRWPWWTEPVRAERLAALRIGLAAVLLLDLATTYLPHFDLLFGGGSLGSPEVFRSVGTAPSWNWSLLRGVKDHRILWAAAILWTVATALLLVGLWTRLSAVIVWVLSTSFATLNPYIDNAGDQVRGIMLFYLMLCPCGAVWSLDHWRARRRRQPTEIRFVPPWPLRLLFIQMALIYFCNGLYKLVGEEWRSGSSLYYVLGDLTLARWSYAQVRVPYELTRLLTWAVMAWELTFPLLVCLPWLGSAFCRAVGLALPSWVRWVPGIALGFGVAFHFGIGLSLELGGFAAYMLCLYLPLVPWERLRGSGVAEAQG